MLKRLYKVWMRFARAVGTVNTYALLLVMFFLVLTPIGIIRRLAGKSIFSRRARSSLWLSRSGDEDMERHF